MFFRPIPDDAIIPDNLMLHIPDGFLNLGVSVICWLIALIILAVAIQRAKTLFDERLVPLAGVMAAFIFAGQMINFPVAGGTSGHLVGATLAFIVLGPWLGLLAMTAVIILQALLFQDGGLVVMGANLLVMGIIPGMVGYGIHQVMTSRSQRWQTVGTGLAAWLSVMGAAFITALLLGLSETTTLAIAIPAMLGIHALIGVGEAIITVAALGLILQARPSLRPQAKVKGGSGWIAAGVFTAVGVVFLSPFASGLPDGLEWVASQNGFINKAATTPYELLPDYTLPFLGETALSTILAGIIGVVIVGVITAVVTRNLRRRSLTS